MTDPDVELKCTKCGRETLATVGRWDPTCWVCGGQRVVTKAHDHALTPTEYKAIGFTVT